LLAATVSNAGGLGSFGANDLAPEDITDKPFGMNLWFATFDQGGDTLEQTAYERIMVLLALKRARIASCLPTALHRRDQEAT
jgi:nitronate monooxygenase